MAHVVFEVEVGIVDPQRSAAASGRECELLAVAGQQMQTPAHVVEHVGERRRWPLEQQHAADVHVRARALLVQEAGVRRCQPIQVLLRHRANPPMPSSLAKA